MRNILKREEVSPPQAAASTEAVKMALRKAFTARTAADMRVGSVLSKLQILLEEHLAEMTLAIQRCARVDEMLRPLTQDAHVILESDAKTLARQLIAGADLTAIVSNDRKPLEKRFYARFGTYEPDDIELIKKLDFERACVMILKEAIKSQKLIVLGAKKASMAEFAQAVAESRSELARKFLAAIAEAEDAAERDRHLADELEPDEIELLSPRPFPKRILSEDVIRWLLAAAATDLIRQDELRGVLVD